MTLHFTPIPTETVRALQAGAPDANGQRPERHVSDGGGNPCRHCLQMIPAGAGMLILAHRPFTRLQPYAESGPIFLCADPCAPGGGPDLPAMLASPDYILRGYSAEERIVYGTGAVVPTARIRAEAEARFADPRVAFLHIRSARNNCFQCRIERL
ncbi:MAG: hypothetical protein A2092_04330 [Rhodobacteraceae bacterium GWE1_64_9]|nr:MAG: hypothetical protein A2092_04330 [Rhodobacteraceae bacterium GWE1_64_9]OHC49069.1 MAG: hypothetical protein A2X69_13860 [Rhodobacteraceae bacterium GWF1_65_7]HBD89820.1 DUF1203 domain-containing protein [Gemmobacter sp.]HBU14916.1 DUF1203 domain-containing protein [Gemmobacter sp.]